jgi:hypothetical protein
MSLLKIIIHQWPMRNTQWRNANSGAEIGQKNLTMLDMNMIKDLAQCLTEVGNREKKRARKPGKRKGARYFSGLGSFTCI